MERLKKANPKLTSEHLSKLFPAEAKFTGVEKMLAKNPGVLKALPGLGAMAGLTMGSSIIGSALTGPRDAALAQQESY